MKRYAGFDIGGTYARVSLFDENWCVVGSERQQIRGKTDPEDVADIMAIMLKDLLLKLSISPPELVSVGVGLAGQMSKDNQVVVHAPNLGWRNERFVERLQNLFGSPFETVTFAMVNDLSALVWGERSEGAVQGVDDILAVYVGTGVGGAIVADGDLLTGAGGKCGEIGHVKVVVGGRLCGCGDRGCVEAYAGGIHLEQQVAVLAHEHDITDVFKAGDAISVDLSVADSLASHVAPIKELWDRSTDYLAISIANACTLLNPGVLLLGGGVLEHCLSYRSRLLQKISPLILGVARDDMDIRIPQLGNDAGVLGAALLAAKNSICQD